MDVNVVCRTCLKENVEMKSIFSEDNSLSKMITACSVTTISELDGLPQQICMQCSENVQTSFNFKEQSERAFSRLKELFVFADSDMDNKENATKVVDEVVLVDGYKTIVSDKLTVGKNEKCIQTEEVCFHPCEMCNLKFLSEEMLKEHRTSHSSFNCRVCSKEYTRLTHLRRHITVAHKNLTLSKALENIVCDICNKTFTRNDHLKRHMLSFHDIDLRIDQSSSFGNCDKAEKDSECFNCSLCKKLFQNATDFKKHAEECGKSKQSSKPPHKKIKTDRFEDDDDDYFLDDNTYDELIGSTIDHDGSAQATVAAVIEPKITRRSRKNSTVPLELVQVEDLSQDSDDKMLKHIKQQKINEGATAEIGVFESLTLESVKAEKISDTEEDLALPRTLGIEDFSKFTADNIKQDDTTLANSDVDKNSILDNIGKNENEKNDKDDESSGIDGDDDDYKEVNSSSSSDDDDEEEEKPKRGRGRPRKAGAPVKMPKQPKVKKDQTSHTCIECKKTFSRANHLKRHMLVHSDIKPFSCEVCKKSFTRMDHLNIHRFSHQEVKPFTCDICGKGFIRAEHLARHKESQHCSGPRVEVFCEFCCKKFNSLKSLRSHMKTHEIREYVCRFCDKKYTKRQSLTDHLKKHVNERPFLCSECGMRFLRNDYLVIHMRRHKGEKPYKCKYCDKGFPRATDLNVHERYHTGEKTHLCTTCGKGFQRAYNLVVHNRVHTGEKPYQCPHCDRSFAQGNDLKAHVRRHTGERYKCDVCGEGFIQGYHLTQHKRNVHGIDVTSHIRRLEKFLPSGDPAPDDGVDGAPTGTARKKNPRKAGRIAAIGVATTANKIAQQVDCTLSNNGHGTVQTNVEIPEMKDEIKMEPNVLHGMTIEITDSQSSAVNFCY